MVKTKERRKYEKNQPLLSCRVSRDIYDNIVQIVARTGKSKAQVIREILEDHTTAVESAADSAYFRGKQKWQLSYHCSECGGRIPVKPTGLEAREAVEFLESEQWCHKRCA